MAEDKEKLASWIEVVASSRGARPEPAV